MGAESGTARPTTKLTLFFTPLFPVRERHQPQCGHCGASYDVPAPGARRLVA